MVSHAMSLLTLVQAGGRVGQNADGRPAAAAAATNSGAASDGGSATSSHHNGEAGSRPKAGKGSRGPRPRLFGKNECQADGCSVDTSALPRYHQRNHICVAHKVADSFLRQGVEVRFCQRCGVSHPLAEFEGLKKSCARQLAAHNNRRRKHAPTAAAPAPAAAPREAPAPAAAAGAAEVPEAAAAAAAQLEPQLGLPLVAPAALQPLMEAELSVEGADWAPASLAGASLEDTPEASVGSAGLSAPLPDTDPASWLLGDLGDVSSGGGGGGTTHTHGGALPASPLLLPWELAQEQLGAAGEPLVSAPCVGAAQEWVCCGRACGACDACDAGPSAPAGIPAAAPAAAAAAAAPLAARPAAAAASGTGRPGGAPVTAQPALLLGTPAAAAGRGGSAENDTADSRAVGVSPAAAAAAAAAVAGDAAAGPARSAAAAAATAAEAAATAAAAAAAAASLPSGSHAAAVALERLQQQNAAVYSVLVQQQLLAAQTLLATAGMVLSQRLPLGQHGTCSLTSY